MSDDQGGDRPDHSPAADEGANPTTSTQTANDASSATTHANGHEDSKVDSTAAAADSPRPSHEHDSASAAADVGSPSEPHRLNADSGTATEPNTDRTSSNSHELEQDSFILVAQLRSQITDLTSQVTSLNTKLVRSYTTNGDLEDELHDTREREAQLKKRCAQLEKDSAKWEKEIEGGGWVERAHVQGEMQRLMSKVLEETKTRETAVEAHTALETEIDSLTSQLFDEANKMVAVERVARARADEKLRSLEESGQTMQALFEEVQVNLRDTVGELENKDRQLAELKEKLAAAGVNPEVSDDPAVADSDMVVSDGSNVQVVAKKPLPNSTLLLHSRLHAVPPQLLKSVLPFYEFLAFIQYLRQVRTTALTRPIDSPSYAQSYGTAALAARGFGPSSIPVPQSAPPPPSATQLLTPYLLLSTHTAQPFIKRCMEEDSEPSLRLDAAPGLGLFSRRTVGTAVVDGTLLIEPLSSGGELPSATCALCGMALERWARGASVVKATGPAAGVAGVNQTMKKMLGGGSWSISSLTGGTKAADKSTTTNSSSSGAQSPTSIKTGPVDPLSFAAARLGSTDPEHIVHVFRVGDNASTRYAICPTYCLPRLRAVCDFWTYIRSIERGLLLDEGFRYSKPSTEHDATAPKGGMASARASVEGLGLSSATASASASKTDLSTVVQEVESDIEKMNAERATETTAKDEGETKQKADTSNADVGESEREHEGSPDPSTSPVASVAAVLTAHNNGSSSSLSKPPVPRRSAARAHGASTPVEGSVTSSPIVREEAQAGFAVDGVNSPIVAPNGTTPVLPPRPPPRHPASTPKGVAEQMPLTVGDGTGSSSGWEDRCWTEIVRLKENVFWTRVAAIRDDPSS